MAPNPDSADTLTKILAIWGAVVSTIAVVWNIVRDILKRPKVRLSAMVAYETPSLTKHEVIAISVTNVGHQPVVIQGIAADQGKRKGGVAHVLTCRHIPRRLEPKDFLVESATDFGFIGPGVKRVYAWDSEGREWELSKKNLKQIRDAAIKKNLLSAASFSS